MKKFIPWVLVMAAVLFAARNVYVRFFAIPDLSIETAILTDSEGEQYDIRRDDHPYILISYVQSWCRDCILEIPSMLQLRKEKGEDQIQVVLISDEPRANINQIEKRFDGNISVYRSGKSLANMGIQVFPTTYLLGPDRKILLVKKEGFDWNSEMVRAMVH
jgi:thiol-disulfide isomerase/thioredoxin